ncbi:hypothetical protein LTR37_012027 [Vermiconidia calcicola]|uniref:Uncharacterized protein n=1 Tax=Vermiconidia calcicola TaxID=1690605 RepID=A0ACC3N086_9PEZI|nr:hypothetical protein LTR37_012027 [Vermiconidia calcicola]
MAFEVSKPDDQQPESAERTELLDGATLDVSTDKSDYGSAAVEAQINTTAGPPPLPTHSSIDSGIGADDQFIPPPPQDIIGGHQDQEQQQQQPQEEAEQPQVEAQLAEEQELVPDVRRIPRRHRRRKRWSVSHNESITTSLTESIWNYRQEHGRTYHAYKDGKYIFPNDEREADRLDLQHHLFRITFANHLYFAPLHAPKRCLDVGTGTGIWAIDFADEFPECQVIGIDLSPGQPNLVPPNVKFVVDDAEDMWVYQDKFDYIHFRLMAGCFADWPKVFRQAYENLIPGGWLELQDYGLPVKSADGTADGTDLMRWGELLCEAARKLGRPMGSDCADHYLTWMSDAGFVDIQQRMFMWPSNGWPKDPLMKTLGHWNQTNILEGLEGFCLALLTRGLGWRKEEVDIFVARVSKDLRDRKIHAYFPMPVAYARKPFPGEVAFTSY